jgi:tRNA-specific adenosine deaminase 1
MWRSVAEVAAVLAVPALLGAVREMRYQDMKNSELLGWRRAVKADVKGADGPLKGWPENKGDDDFGLP